MPGVTPAHVPRSAFQEENFRCLFPRGEGGAKRGIPSSYDDDIVFDHPGPDLPLLLNEHGQDTRTTRGCPLNSLKEISIAILAQ
jgi:hypothetical protein